MIVTGKNQIKPHMKALMKLNVDRGCSAKKEGVQLFLLASFPKLEMAPKELFVVLMGEKTGVI